MSRIGEKPIPIPSGVTVEVEPGNRVRVKGPKGELSEQVSPDLSVAIEEGQVLVARPSQQARHRSQHGLARTLISNMVVGVSQGFEKGLEIHGVGYRATVEGSDLVLNIGYSHPVRVSPPPGIQFEVGQEDRSRIIQVKVRGIDRQKVGQVAADIRRVRKPDPYKGKGIRYQGEYIKLKQGKRAAS
ncbi:MAG: 50S ribosomal protein L6 [Fimbriimonadales bacterium]|nr:MAG: 50S ribosomal protein L6 [Armatimonadota bacterium]MBV6502654.1 50S ribosomal protein L6 [Fimbriimonadales bacterium]MCE7898499.1 50S ribosomal protein L6 [Armatimonadetes bacterium ATM1]MDL1928208.1 50S ribosomal protein L6 [Fimbriimonadia bacterium ATM]MBC6968662.1 50S ribosomal protein L6 [Armatimonadota bacterium]